MCANPKYLGQIPLGKKYFYEQFKMLPKICSKLGMYVLCCYMPLVDIKFSVHIMCSSAKPPRKERKDTCMKMRPYR